MRVQSGSDFDLPPMQLTFINQPFDGAGKRAGDHLVELIARSAEFDRFRLAVAWVRRSGMQRLFGLMTQFRQKGGRIEAVVGIDLKGTSIQGLQLLKRVANSVVVFQNANRKERPTYHPKLYVLSGVKNASVVLGSSNLTKGGLYTNYEHNVRLDLDLLVLGDQKILKAILDGFDELRNVSNGLARELTDEFFQKLIERDLLIDEDSESAKHGRTGDEEPKEVKEKIEPLFGTMAIEPPPSVPKLAGGKSAARTVNRAAEGHPSFAAASQVGTSSSHVPLSGAAPLSLTMRPYPQRGGTQVQVPQEVEETYFKGITHVESQHDRRRHPISPARTKSRSVSRSGRVVNTLKLEVPECRGKGVPIIQFTKDNGTVTYRVFDGNVGTQGNLLLASLEANLASGDAKQTRKGSTIWMLH